MLKTEARSEGHNDSETVFGTPRPYMYPHAEFVILKTIIIGDMLCTRLFKN